ncbi:MAG: hypothetical protein AAF581_11690 [Planctomycetota bacterium]
MKRRRLALLAFLCVGIPCLYCGSYCVLRLGKVLVRQSYVLFDYPDLYEGRDVTELKVPELAEVDYIEVYRSMEAIGSGSYFAPKTPAQDAIAAFFAPPAATELYLRGLEPSTIETVAVDVLGEDGESQAVAGPPRYQLIPNDPFSLQQR